MSDAGMIAALRSRVAIIGNSGSGKTTLARRLGERASLPLFHLDDYDWIDEKLELCHEAAADAKVEELQRAPRWIIEGVFGWFIARMLPSVTSLIWLDLPWTTCKEGLEERRRKGVAGHDHERLLLWAEAYWRRTSCSSYAGHLALFESFAGCKRRFASRAEIAALLVETPGGA